MKIALSQLNYIVGNIEYNTEKIIHSIHQLQSNADIIVFSELSVTGYPPMDLLEHSKLINNNIDAAEQIAKEANECAVIFGFIHRDTDGTLYNSCAFAVNGKIAHIRNKTLLPTYDVFDEKRYFKAAQENTPIEFNGTKLGLTICEDIWNNSTATSSVFFTDQRKYTKNPFKELCNQNAEIIINIAASPYVMGKNQYKQSFISDLAKTAQVPVVYCNQVGGNDSLVFDGTSFACNKEGYFYNFAHSYKEDSFIFDTKEKQIKEKPEESLTDIESALVLGVQDYMSKCGFKKAVLGLSGGIDSALTAALAVKAVGAENVMGITMPSKYSSRGSVNDSVELAKNLDIRIEEIAIHDIFSTYNSALNPMFSGCERDVTEENLQARIRGTLLMAASNKFGALLLTTGNKSELAMGYCTLYGDMNGGLAVISDVPKTLVFKLARHMNRDKILIPENTITKPPSAELREDQKDEDSLPPYEILDAILKEYIEFRKSRSEIIEMGFDEETVDFVLRTTDRNEYKRRQAAPGLKITSKAFGTGRRIPMAQGFKA